MTVHESGAVNEAAFGVVGGNSKLPLSIKFSACADLNQNTDSSAARTTTVRPLQLSRRNAACLAPHVRFARWTGGCDSWIVTLMA